MRRLLMALGMVLALLPVSCVAQPGMIRGFFNTNADPIVDVLAGAGITVTPTVTLPNQRHFTVALTGGGGITAADGTNIAITVSKAATNDLWAYTLILSNNVWLMSTQWVQAQGYATTNQVIDATNSLWGFALILSNNVWLMSTQWVQGQGYATTNQFNLALTNYENRAVTFSNNFLVTSTDHSNSISLNTNGSIMVSNANGILSITPDNLTGTSEFSIKSGLTAQTMLRLNTNGTFIIGTNAISDGSLVNAVIAGGHLNTNLGSGGQGKMSFIGGGASNYLRNTSFSFIGGGWMNRITNSGESVIVGGHTNSINAGNYDFIGSGFGNRIASSIAATIGGGFGNVAIGDYAFVGGGFSNRANATAATIPGGVSNIVIVGADYSFAAGSFANASHAGTFVWSDSTGSPTTGVTSSAPNEVTMRATGGFRLLTGAVKATGPVTSTNGYYVFDSVGTHLDAVLTNGGGTFTAPVLSGSASTSAPASTEFVVAGHMSNYVNNAVAALGAHIFSSGTASNNVSATRTNTFQGWVGGQTAITTNKVLNADLVINNYIRHVVSTQLFLGIGGGTISVQAYVWRDGVGTVSIHPEVYESSGTAPIEHGSSATDVVTATTPTLHTWFIPVTSTNFASATNIIWAWKADVAKPVTANLYFASGGIYPSHVEIVQNPGNVTIDASQVVSGTLADARLSTNVPLLNAVNTFNGNSNLFNRKVIIGNKAPSAEDSGLLISRTAVNPLSLGGSHAVRDESIYNVPAGSTAGYVSFDAIPTVTGTNALYAHLAAFQSRPEYTGTGTLSYVFGLSQSFTHNGSGTVTSVEGLKFNDTTGTGPVESQYGVRIASLTKATNNYAIVTEGTTPSSFGGTINASGSLKVSGAVSITNGLVVYGLVTSTNLTAQTNSANIAKSYNGVVTNVTGVVHLNESGVITNVYLPGSYLSNAFQLVYDMSKPRQFTNCAQATITISGLTGVTTAFEELESSLTLRNTNAGSVTLNLPANWFTPDGAHAYVITNGHHGELAVKVWAGECTNAAFRDLRIAP